MRQKGQDLSRDIVTAAVRALRQPPHCLPVLRFVLTMLVLRKPYKRALVDNVQNQIQNVVECCSRELSNFGNCHNKSTEVGGRNEITVGREGLSVRI